jgi:hypothetical protein
MDVRSAGAKGAYIEWKYYTDSVKAGFTPSEKMGNGKGWKTVKGCPVKKSTIKTEFETKIVGFDRDTTMRIALRKKFENPILRQALLDTGDAALAEVGGARGSLYWSNRGENKLGIFLMELRTELRSSI